jgi:uncharacterized protein (DUF433 family)
MMIQIALGIGTIFAVTFLLWLVLDDHPHVRSTRELMVKSRPVDIDAFRNLVSRDEEEFLRSHLSRADFRQVQRMRLKAALEYARRTSYNAALLLQLARLSRNAPSPEAAKAAAQLADDALQMRVSAMVAISLLHARILAPGLRIRPVAIVERYEGLRESMSRLVRVQLPTAVSSVDAAL